MFPFTHCLLSAIFAALMFPIFKFQALIIFLAAFLVDIDHYILYVALKNDWSLKNAYKFMSTKCKIFEDVLCNLHTVEFFILLAILSFYFRFAFLIFIGVMFHEVVDLIDFAINKKWRIRALSFFMWLKRNYSPSNSIKLKTE